jgi:hypothetical protein
MVDDVVVAALVGCVVTASFPFYVYGAWYIINQEVVTWSVLVHHLKFVVTGLVLTTVPVLTWMLPRLLEKFGGLTALHAFLGLQAYALLAFGLWGIVRIFQAKHAADLYGNPDQDVSIDELHENMGKWRSRLRVGVFGYVFFWILAYLVGVLRFVVWYTIF